MVPLENEIYVIIFHTWLKVLSLLDFIYDKFIM